MLNKRKDISNVEPLRITKGEKGMELAPLQSLLLRTLGFCGYHD